MRNLSTVCILLFFTSCTSTLKNTSFEQEMKQQGSFTCPKVVELLNQEETFAEGDVSRVRCYQDEWQIHGTEKTLIRILYQSPHCEIPLGKITYVETIDSPLNACQLVRSTPAWLSENKSDCVLKDLKIGVPTSLASLKKCTKNIPAFCLHPDHSLVIEPKKNSNLADPFNVILVSGAGHYQALCKRYQK